MAFMLMLPLDPVIQELKRVLKRGARFSAVIWNSRGKTGLFGDIQRFTYGFINARYPQVNEAKAGDPRAQSETNIRALLSPANGFLDPIVFKDTSLLIKTDPQGVWDLMKEMYLVSFIPQSEKDELERKLKEFAATLASPDGTLSFNFGMLMFTATKA